MRMVFLKRAASLIPSSVEKPGETFALQAGQPLRATSPQRGSIRAQPILSCSTRLTAAQLIDFESAVANHLLYLLVAEQSPTHFFQAFSRHLKTLLQAHEANVHSEEQPPAMLSGSAFFSRSAPSQHRLARSGDLVQTADLCGQRRLLE